MRRTKGLLSLGLLGAAMLLGCSQSAPPPERVDSLRERAYDDGPPGKPLPPQAREDDLPPPPFNDVPLVSQRAPEEQAFVNAYNAVGKPRIVVFVNRSPYEGGNGPITPDELSARGLDYAAVETILTDWLSAGGRVAVISPTVGSQMLNAQQQQALRSTQPTAGRDVAQQVEADILVQVQAQPTYQTRPGTEVRMVGEAIDLRHGGASLGRAVVDVPPPLDKPQINKYTRYIARKLMSDMTSAWESFGTPPPGGQGTTSPTGALPPGAVTQPPPESGSAPTPPAGNAPTGATSSNGGLAPNPADPLPQPVLPIYPATRANDVNGNGR